MTLAITTAPQRKPDGDKAQRIIAAMRSSVGARGAAGSTFDQVAQEAGVSRGLLHYYFGSKERLLAEVVRHDCDLRLAALEQRLARADSLDAIVDVLVTSLEAFLDQDASDDAALIYEMFSASRHHEEMRAEMAELYRRMREQVGAALREKEREGIAKLRGDADAVASILFALADGMALQRLSDPDWDSRDAFTAGALTARHLLGG